MPGLPKPSVPPVGRAQDFSTSELRQHLERGEATTSIGRVMQDTARTGPTTSVLHHGGFTVQPSTSVAHPGGYAQRASTSIAHPGSASQDAQTSVRSSERAKRSVYDEEYYDEDRDKARYEYARRRILERRAQNRTEAKQEGTNADRAHITVHTGAAFTKGGAAGFTHEMRRFFKQYSATYKNISQKDRDLFIDIVGRRAQAKRTGETFTHIDKRKMRAEFMQAFKNGKITREDMRDFHKLINNL